MNKVIILLEGFKVISASKDSNVMQSQLYKFLNVIFYRFVDEAKYVNVLCRSK